MYHQNRALAHNRQLVRRLAPIAGSAMFGSGREGEKQNDRSGEIKSQLWSTAARRWSVVDDGGGQRMKDTSRFSRHKKEDSLRESVSYIIYSCIFLLMHHLELKTAMGECKICIILVMHNASGFTHLYAVMTGGDTGISVLWRNSYVVFRAKFAISTVFNMRKSPNISMNLHFSTFPMFRRCAGVPMTNHCLMPKLSRAHPFETIAIYSFFYNLGGIFGHCSVHCCNLASHI